jgi:hypothetical protein
MPHDDGPEIMQAKMEKSRWYGKSISIISEVDNDLGAGNVDLLRPLLYISASQWFTYWYVCLHIKFPFE